MKTIFHANIDGYEIITGFADATPDPMATMAKISPMLPGLPEQQAVNEINDKIAARRQKVIDEFKGIFGHEPIELRSGAEGQWFAEARHKCEQDVSALATLLVDPTRARDLAVKRLYDANTVYFQPGELEYLDTENRADTLIPIFVGRSDSEQVQLDGTLIPDFRGRRVWQKGIWRDRVISKLGDKPGDDETLDDDLSDTDRSTIADKKETERVYLLTTEQKTAEVKMILDGLAAQAAARKDEAIIKGESTDHALRDAQAWYKAEEEKVRAKYEL